MTLPPFRYLVLLAAPLVLAACGEPQETRTEEIVIERELDGPGVAALQHTVYLWLVDGLSAADSVDFVDGPRGVRSLETIPSVRTMNVGAPAATPSRGVVDNSFDLALVVGFDDVAGHDAYQEHPTHLAFVGAHEDKFAEVRVYDHVVDGEAAYDGAEHLPGARVTVDTIVTGEGEERKVRIEKRVVVGDGEFDETELERELEALEDLDDAGGKRVRRRVIRKEVTEERGGGR